MARHPFGGGLSDWAIIPDASGLAVLTGGAIVTLWSLPTGGTQYTDLTDTASAAISSVTSSDGTDGLVTGQIPQFYGPDGVWVMWAAINDSDPENPVARQMMCSTDIGAQVDAQATAAGVLQTTVNSFGALLGADNGIATLGADGILVDNQRPAFTLAAAADVDVSSAADGDVLSYNATAGKWEAQASGTLAGWTDLTLASGLSAHGGVTPAYRFLLADTVQLVGEIKKTAGGTFTSPTTLLTLPAEARPTQPKYLTSAAARFASQGDCVQMAINPDGTVVASWQNASYAPDWIGIDCLLYDLGGS
jgi:hypothetical protein